MDRTYPGIVRGNKGLPGNFARRRRRLPWQGLASFSPSFHWRASKFGQSKTHEMERIRGTVEIMEEAVASYGPHLLNYF